MQKLRQLLICAFILGTTVIGCKEQSNLHPSDQVNQPLDLMGQLQKELGVKLTAKEIVVTDASGKNKATIRLIGESEAAIKSYLEHVEYSIIPVYDRKEYAGATQLKARTKSETQSKGSASSIYTETVSSALADGVLGFKIRVRSLDVKSSLNARPAYAQYATHVSPNWCEAAYVQNNTNCCNVSWNLRVKSSWSSSWILYFQYSTVAPGTAQSYYYDNYRAEIGVDYDVNGDYTYWFLCD